MQREQLRDILLTKKSYPIAMLTKIKIPYCEYL